MKHLFATVDEVSETGSRVIREVQGHQIALFNVDGEFYAVENYCPHQAGPLCEGPLTGYITADRETWELRYERGDELIECPWHSWKFDVKTGKNVKSQKYSVPTYEVVVDDGDIYVRL